MAKKKNKKNTPPQINNLSNQKWLSLAAFILVGVLIFYPPFFRGLFFKQDMFLYHLFTGLVFIVVWIDKIKKKDYTLIRTPLDWAVLAFAGAYLLSLIGAVHPGEAFYGFLKALNYFMVYWMVTQVIKDYKTYAAALNVLLAAGVGVALIGLLSATGCCHYPAAVDNGVIQSTLQYCNATAAYLAVMSLLGTVLWIRRQSLVLKLIYGIATYLCALVVLAAVSKGAWLIWLIGIIILLIGMPGLYKIKAFYSLTLALGAAFITSDKFIPAITGPNIKTGLPLLLIGIIVVLAGQAVWEAMAWLNRKHGSRVVIAAAIVLVIAGTVALSTFSHQLTRLAPKEMITEGMQIFDSGGDSYSYRTDFYLWGLAIVKDHPVFGTGADGWNALYHQYQDYSIFTTEVHNHFLQVWIEAGTLGFIAFLAMWVLFLWAVCKLYKTYNNKKAENSAEIQDHWVLIWGTATAILACGAHAAFDFDLSMAALSIMLWTLMALINATLLLESNLRPINIRPVVNISMAMVLSLILIFCGSSYTLACNYANKGMRMEKSLYEKNSPQQINNLLQVEDCYLRAVSLNSLEGDYYANLGRIYAVHNASLKNSGQAGVKEYYSRALNAMAKAEDLKPYNTRTRNSLLTTSLMLGGLEQSIRHAEWTVKINPNDINSYAAEANIVWSATLQYMKLQDYDKAGQYARRTIAVETRLTKHRQKVKEDSPLWHGAKLDPTPQMCLNIAQAHYLLGQYQQSMAKLQPYINSGTPIPEACAWYAADLYRLGQKDKAEQIINANPQQTQTYNTVINQGPLK